MSEIFAPSHNPCANCGGAVDTDSRFCKHCGFDLTKSASPSETSAVTSSVQSNRKTNSILLIVGLVVVLVVTLFSISIYKRNHGQSNGTNAATPTPSPSSSMSDRAKQVEEKILRGETLSESDITGLTDYELRILRNVHFARYGRKYESPGLGDYFNTRSWYKPSDSYNDTMITANDRANINLILLEENKIKGGEVASTTNTPSVAPSATPSNTNGLSERAVEEAVKKAFGKLQRDGRMESGANIRVVGIQELPGLSAAKADLDLGNAIFLQDDMLRGRWEIGKGGYGGRMVYPKKRIRIETSTAMLKRYTNGHWILESLDTHSYEFGVVKVNIGLE